MSLCSGIASVMSVEHDIHRPTDSLHQIACKLWAPVSEDCPYWQMNSCPCTTSHMTQERNRAHQRMPQGRPPGLEVLQRAYCWGWHSQDLGRRPRAADQGPLPQQHCASGHLLMGGARGHSGRWGYLAHHPSPGISLSTPVHACPCPCHHCPALESSALGKASHHFSVHASLVWAM